MIVEKNPFRGGHLAYPHLSKIANTPKQAGKKPEIAREPGQIIFKIVREILKTVREHLSAGPKGRFSLRPEARIFLIFEPL